MTTHTRQLVAGSQHDQLVNGGFEIAQRGAGPFTTHASYTLDRWQLTLGGASTASVTPITSTVGSQGQSLQCGYTHAAGGVGNIGQKIEHYVQLRGQVLTFAATVKSSVAGTLKLYLQDNATTFFSPYTGGTGSQRLVVSGLIGSAATIVNAGFLLDVGSATVEVNDATLCVGGVPLDYVPLHPAEDLARCLRYYEVHGAVASGLATFGYQAASSPLQQIITFAAPKGGAPTMTKNGTWAVSNCGQPSVTAISPNTYTLSATVTALGAAGWSTNSTDDTVVAEWNP